MASPKCVACEATLHCARCGKPVAVPNTHIISIFPDKLPTVDEWERLLVSEAMRRTNGSRIHAAKMVGIKRTTMYRRYPKGCSLDD